MSLYIAMDIGGTKLLCGAVDAVGRIVRRATQPTPLGLDEGLEALGRMARDVAAGEPFAAIGAAAGGPLDWQTGVVSPLHQPEWKDVPLKSIFEAEFDVPFAVDVDTNVAALAEYRFGPAKPARLVYLTISTGVGGGIILDGAIYRGAAGAHPEVGHQAIPYRLTGPASGDMSIGCECGAAGCLEALVSGQAIRRLYGKPAEELNDRQWEEVGYNLGQGLRNIAAMYAPDVIALGGGVAVGGGERLLAAARREMAAGLKIVPIPEVRLSALGYDTALLGAAALAMDLV